MSELQPLSNDPEQMGRVLVGYDLDGADSRCIAEVGIRLVTAARLIDNGASVQTVDTQNGPQEQLIITGRQIIEVETAHENLSVLRQPITTKTLTPVEGSDVMPRTVTALTRAGVGCLLDLVVLGKKQVGALRLIGPDKVRYLEGVLKEQAPNVTWHKQQPPMDYVKTLTEGDISRVSGLVVGLSLSTRIDAQHFMSLKRIPSVHDLVTLSLDEIVATFVDSPQTDGALGFSGAESLTMLYKLEQYIEAARNYKTRYDDAVA